MPFTHEHKKQIQAFLQQQLQANLCSILADNWNAALHSNDRSARDGEDNLETHRLLGLDTSYQNLSRHQVLHDWTLSWTTWEKSKKKKVKQTGCSGKQDR